MKTSLPLGHLAFCPFGDPGHWGCRCLTAPLQPSCPCSFHPYSSLSPQNTGPPLLLSLCPLYHALLSLRGDCLSPSEDARSREEGLRKDSEEPLIPISSWDPPPPTPCGPREAPA